MGSKKEYWKFIDDFKNKKFHRSYSLKDFDLYSYSSNKGKFGFSNLLLDILVRDFSPVEVKLFLGVIARLKQGRVFEESAVAHLKYSIYSEICSDTTFYASLRKFVEYGLLIPTPLNKYYIVNPLYVNKFLKTKIEK